MGEPGDHRADASSRSYAQRLRLRVLTFGRWPRWFDVQASPPRSARELPVASRGVTLQVEAADVSEGSVLRLGLRLSSDEVALFQGGINRKRANIVPVLCSFEVDGRPWRSPRADREKVFHDLGFGAPGMPTVGARPGEDRVWRIDVQLSSLARLLGLGPHEERSVRIFLATSEEPHSARAGPPNAGSWDEAGGPLVVRTQPVELRYRCGAWRRERPGR